MPSSASSLTSSHGLITAHYLIHSSDIDTLKCHDFLVMALCNGDVSWNCCNNPYFCEFQEVLRPGSRPLTADAMGGPVLNRIHVVVEFDKTLFKKDSMVVTLLSDGLTDISHKSITNYIGQN